VADAPTDRAPGSGDSEKADLHAEVLVLGAGPGGYTAAFRAADLGKRVVLVERHAALGGVCLNVGCIPSKTLLHVAEVITAAAELAPHGVAFGAPALDFAKLRAHKDEVVGRLTDGLATLAKQRKVEVVRGTGRFAAPHRLAVATDEGERSIGFDHAIVAAGSRPAQIPGFPNDDPRVMDSSAALEVDGGVRRLLVVGGGIIGLEMAAVYAALGAEVTVVEALKDLMSEADPDPPACTSGRRSRGSSPKRRGCACTSRAGRRRRRRCTTASWWRWAGARTATASVPRARG
jgi:dihydrolipoamide dehydrogenase